MDKLHAEQTLDTLGRTATHEAIRNLAEEEVEAVAGGDGPPSTAGDGNGRVALRIY